MAEPADRSSINETLAADRPSINETLGATLDGTHLLRRQTIGVGTEVAGHRLDERLGAGGMGEVFLATRLGDGRQLALKVLSEVHAARLYRFKREFRALADVRHDNLIALEELVVLEDGRAFFTMEHVDGVAFVDYVRQDVDKGQLPNLVRLQRALVQLVMGIRHLHRTGCIHRDIKPSNVLVTRDGRVVVLDFGLVSELPQSGQTPVDDGMTRDGQLMGTPAYMAPEQAGGPLPGPAVDYYAIGIMLFECLTGTLPFRGQILDILIDKRQGKLPNLRERLYAEAPRSKQFEALSKLCMDAMTPEPEGRPGAEDFLAVLGQSQSPPSPAESLIHRPRGPFVGRQAELDTLTDALATVCSRLEPVAVHIRGSSGLGKSALIMRFLDDARRREGSDLVVLRGRCLERESVPYKGIDAVVDALAVYLRNLDPLAAAALQPRHLGALSQLFPVLGDAWPDDGRRLDLDPAELRRRGLGALREVLARVGERHSLVLTIDDFQWADVDSARVVTELMRPPDPPAMLLVVTFRDEVDSREPLRLLTSPEAVAGRDVRDLAIEPLSAQDAHALALALLAQQGEHSAAQPKGAGQPGQTRDSASVYARRAQGNPFYIGQMVLGDDTHESSDASLDRLVARRIVALADGPRGVLATVAVAGGPTPLNVALRASASLIPATNGDTSDASDASETFDHDAVLRELEGANLLLRHVHPGRPDDIESAHDRIRTVTVGELSPSQLRAAHLAIAEAFEALGGGEAQALAEHFALAGDEVRALDYTQQAAGEAAAALAFDRAVELYRRALALLRRSPNVEADADGSRRRALELALAKQLVDLGRGAEAADLFEELAAGAESPRAARALRRRAAGERVKAGYLDEGMDTITPVLREVGVWQPQGVLSAILGTLWNRLLLALRGYDFTRRTEAQIDPDLLERIDSLLATKTGLSHHEAIFAGYQQSKAIRLALRAGEPKRLIRCLVHDASIFVALGRREKGTALMATARELLEFIEEPEFHRVVEYVTANHLDHSGRWIEAAEGFARLQERLEYSPNSGWIRGASTVQWNWIEKLLGRYAKLRAELPERVAQARDLGLHHSSVTLGSLLALTQAVYGEVEAAQILVAQLREQWHPRQVTFQHIILAVTEVDIALLAGDAPAALEAAERVLGDTRARIVAGMMPSHVDFYELRARARVRAVIDARPANPRPALASVRKDLARLAKSHKPQAAPLRTILEAAVLAVEGDRRGAETTWRQAAQLLEASALAGHLAAVNTRLGQLGDAEADAAALAYFAEQGIADPQRFVDTVAPAPALDALT